MSISLRRFLSLAAMAALLAAIVFLLQSRKPTPDAAPQVETVRPAAKPQVATVDQAATTQAVTNSAPPAQQVPAPAVTTVAATPEPAPVSPAAEPQKESSAAVQPVPASSATPRSLPVSEATATRRMYGAHAPLRTPVVANPDSAENRKILHTMVTKALVGSSEAKPAVINK